MEPQFEQTYTNLEAKLIQLFESVRAMKNNSYKNNAKLKEIDNQLMDIHQEITQVREDFKEQYRIHELIKSVESMDDYIREDLRKLYNKPSKPTPQQALNKIPNWKPRRSSFSTFESLRNRFKRFTKRQPRKMSIGGRRRTRRH